MASKDVIAAAEEKDNFVIPAKYGASMMMFSMASGGKNVLTLDQLSMMGTMGLNQMVIPMAKNVVSEKKKQLVASLNGSSPPPISEKTDAVLDATIAKGFQKIAGDAKKFIEPFFNVIDTNDSGTISKREFFHVSRIAEIVKNRYNKEPTPEAAKEMLDAVFDLLDTDSDSAISKAEIASYMHRIAHAVGQLLIVVLDTFSELVLDQAVFDSILADVFGLAHTMAPQMGADVFDDSGNVSFAKCAPFLAMLDAKVGQMVTAIKGSQTPAQLATVKTYMDMEQKICEGLASKADASGNVSKADFILVQKEAVKTACANTKQQYTAFLSALPPQFQSQAMLVSGFMNPPAILEKVMSADPFYGIPILEAVIKEFGANDQLNITSMKTVMHMVAGVLMGETDVTPADRAKAAFGLLDADSDGAIASDEAARVLGGVARCTSAMVGAILNVYLEFLGHPDFITGLLSAAEAMAPMVVGSIPGVTEGDLPKFPLQKKFFEGLIAKIFGDSSDGKEEKIKALFDYCDVDQDGVLSFEEFNRIEKDRLPLAQFNMACQMKKTEKMTPEIFASMYENGFSVEADHARLLGDK